MVYFWVREMPPGFLGLIELLRAREVPGAERREAERQAEFEALRCETETEYCSADEEDSCEEL